MLPWVSSRWLHYFSKWRHRHARLILRQWQQTKVPELRGASDSRNLKHGKRLPISPSALSDCKYARIRFAKNLPMKQQKGIGGTMRVDQTNRG